MSSSLRHSSTVVRAASLTFIGQVVGLALTLIATIIMVRALGPAEYGSLTTMVAVLGLLMLLPDFGLSPILIREFAADPAHEGEILGTSIVLRIALLCAAVAAFQVISSRAGISREHVLMIDVLCIGGIFSGRVLGVRNVLDAVYRARMTLGIPTFALLADGVFLVCGAWFVAMNEPRLWNFVLVMTLSPIPGFLLSVGGLRGTIRGHLAPEFQRMKVLMKDAFPIALYAGLTTLYGSTDVLLLGRWKGFGDVGLYAAALRLTAPLQFLPLAISMALFPLQAQASERREQGDRPPFVIGFKMTAALGLAFAVSGIFTAGGILQAVFGEQFRPGGTALSLLLGSTVFGFLNFYIVSFNNATRRQIMNTLIFGGALVVNVLMNIILIPHWSQNAAAAARFTAECVTLTGMIMTVRSHANLPRTPDLVSFLFAGACGVVAGWIGSAMHPLINAGIVFIVVIAGLVGFRFFPWSDVKRVALAIPSSVRPRAGEDREW